MRVCDYVFMSSYVVCCLYVVCMQTKPHEIVSAYTMYMETHYKDVCVCALCLPMSFYVACMQAKPREIVSAYTVYMEAHYEGVCIVSLNEFLCCLCADQTA